MSLEEATKHLQELEQLSDSELEKKAKLRKK